MDCDHSCARPVCAGGTGRGAGRGRGRIAFAPPVSVRLHLAGRRRAVGENQGKTPERAVGYDLRGLHDPDHIPAHGQHVAPPGDRLDQQFADHLVAQRIAQPLDAGRARRLVAF